MTRRWRLVCGKGDVRLRSDHIAISHRGKTKGGDLTHMGTIYDSDQIALQHRIGRKQGAKGGSEDGCDMRYDRITKRKNKGRGFKGV